MANICGRSGHCNAWSTYLAIHALIAGKRAERVTVDAVLQSPGPFEVCNIACCVSCNLVLCLLSFAIYRNDDRKLASVKGDESPSRVVAALFSCYV